MFFRFIELLYIEFFRVLKIRLRDLGVLILDEKLIFLGYYLVFLFVDVRIGKLMLFGFIFRCLDLVFIIVVSLVFKFFFVSR